MEKSLHSSCENFVGQTIYAWPIYGWGWWGSISEDDDDMPSSSIEVPSPFRLHVIRLTHHQGLLNGFMGRVEMPEHPFDGLWAVTYARFIGEFDLISSLPTMDILLGPNEPFLQDLSDDPETEQYWKEKGKEPWYPLWRFNGSPRFGGHAELAASREIWEENSENA